MQTHTKLLTCRKVPPMEDLARPKSAILTASGAVDEISTFYMIMASGLEAVSYNFKSLDGPQASGRGEQFHDCEDTSTNIINGTNSRTVSLTCIALQIPQLAWPA